MPAAIPPVIPDELIVATPGVELVHVPPPVASVSVTVDPVHTEKVPAIAAGSAVTVTLTTVDAVTVPLDTCTVNISVPLYPAVGEYVNPVGNNTPPVEVVL